MDLKKKLHIHSRGKHKKGDTAQLAAQLAPLEELDKSSAAKQLGSGPLPGVQPADLQDGVIVVDNDNLHVPKDIMEGGDEQTFLGLEPVVRVILGVLLAFIAFIASQNSQIPTE